MRGALVLIIAMSLAGCDDDAKALHKILKQCRSTVAVTIHYGFWGKWAEFRCDDMPMDDEKEPSK